MAPERRRWLILALIFAAMVLNYVDRQVVSVLKPTLKAAFAMDDRGYALLVNVFMVSYAGSYAVAGWLVDKFGAGRMMLLGVVGWSCACLGAGLSRTFGQLATMRAALGVTEPTTFPAQLRAVTLWFPAPLRATANSICAAGSTVGAIVAPPLVAWLALRFSWQAAFFVPGAAGLVIAVLWWRVYREPAAAESAVAATVPSAGFTWGELWRTRSLWGILLSRFISDPVWYFCLFWLPGYLQERSGLTLAQIGLVGWIPFLVADLGGIGSAAYSDRLVRRGTDALRARKRILLAAAAVAPVCILTPHLPHPAYTLAIFSLVGAVCLTWLFNLGVVVAEAFPAANVGSVWGIAGACGATGAILFNNFVGQFLASVDPARVFLVMAALHPLAAVTLSLLVRREVPPRATAP